MLATLANDFRADYFRSRSEMAVPRTGRPRAFDRTEALEQAMHLFWEHGYDATSLARLRQAMGGLSSASFYAAFRSKEALFDEAFATYLAGHGRVMAPLNDASLSPRTAIETVLRGSARMQSDSSHPFGCMLVLATAACAPESRPIQARLAGERHRNRAALRARVAEAVAAGTLRPGTDADALAAMFDTFLLGLSTQARDGVSAAVLDAAITQVMGEWDHRSVTSDVCRPGVTTSKQ